MPLSPAVTVNTQGTGCLWPATGSVRAGRAAPTAPPSLPASDHASASGCVCLMPGAHGPEDRPGERTEGFLPRFPARGQLLFSDGPETQQQAVPPLAARPPPRSLRHQVGPDAQEGQECRVRTEPQAVLLELQGPSPPPRSRQWTGTPAASRPDRPRSLVCSHPQVERLQRQSLKWYETTILGTRPRTDVSTLPWKQPPLLRRIEEDVPGGRTLLSRLVPLRFMASSAVRVHSIFFSHHLLTDTKAGDPHYFKDANFSLNLSIDLTESY